MPNFELKKGKSYPLITGNAEGVNIGYVLHDKIKETEIDRNEFGKERRDHWKNRVESIEGEE